MINKRLVIEVEKYKDKEGASVAMIHLYYYSNKVHFILEIGLNNADDKHHFQLKPGTSAGWDIILTYQRQVGKDIVEDGVYFDMNTNIPPKIREEIINLISGEKAIRKVEGDTLITENGISLLTQFYELEPWQIYRNRELEEKGGKDTKQ